LNSDFIQPKADPELYRLSELLVKIAFAVPAPFLLIDLLTCGDWFARSGALALFLVAFAQFRLLSALQDKHIWNAERARKNEKIQTLSAQYKSLEKLTFWAGLYGTGIWAYGDKLTKLATS
jgi:hypothetical protein